MLGIERAVVDSRLFRQATRCAVANPATVQAAVAAAGTLTTQQDLMVRTICSSGDGIEVVEGIAGAGKTFALATAREAWEASGYRVIGCSLAARAARHLQDDAGIPACTIDRLLTTLARTPLAAGTVVVVDEAAMVGTRKLARLLTHAEYADAKVVLVGDPCQLPEIDAGGAPSPAPWRTPTTRRRAPACATRSIACASAPPPPPADRPGAGAKDRGQRGLRASTPRGQVTRRSAGGGPGPAPRPPGRPAGTPAARGAARSHRSAGGPPAPPAS